MGEIKSTLDLVMARTQHLSLSAEEKSRQQRDEFDKRLSGLLQQYADTALTVTELKNRLEKLLAEIKLSGPPPVSEAVLARVDPERDNRHWLELLQELSPSAREPLQKLLASYSDRKTDILTHGGRRILDNLSRHHGISGSAVLPNPQKDPLCRQELAALHSDARNEIKSLS